MKYLSFSPLEYLLLFKLLRGITKLCRLHDLEHFYHHHLFNKNFRFVDSDVEIVVNWALAGFINNDFEMHKVFVKYLFEVVLVGYGAAICSVCRDSHRVFTDKFPKVADFILLYAYISPPDTNPSMMVCKLRGYPW